eukprot:14290723-Heterocapsa_arctica.AAC.1
MFVGRKAQKTQERIADIGSNRSIGTAPRNAQEQSHFDKDHEAKARQHDQLPVEGTASSSTAG